MTAPQGLTVGGTTTPNVGWLDVRLTPTSGDEIDMASLADLADELTITGAGAGDVAQFGLVAPIRLPGTSVYRFFVSGSFTAGEVEVAFAAGVLRSGINPNAADSESFTVQQPTAALADPPSSGVVGSDVINGRSFFDVGFTLPAYATAIDIASVTDLAPEFLVAAATPADGTVVLDATQAPIYLGVIAGKPTFRYFFTGTLSAGSAVSITFIGDSAQFLDAASKPIPLFAPFKATVVEVANPANTAELFSAIDVPFGETGLLDKASILDGDAEFTIDGVAGVTYTLMGEVSDRAGAYRYRVTDTATGDDLAVGTKFTVTYVAGTWDYCAGACTSPAGVLQTAAATPTVGGRYIDVTFDAASAAGLDAASITDAGAEISLAGAGLGSIALDATRAPSILPDGRTVRYYLDGEFDPGLVTVTFAAGSWQDAGGNLALGGSQSFQVVERVEPPPADGAIGQVFFIDISGSIELRLADLFDGEPIIEIRGKASFEAGKRLVGGVEKTRLSFTASGTIKVIKLGNIASGAASFVLEFGGIGSVPSSGASPPSRRTSSSCASTASTPRAARCCSSTRPTTSSARRSRSRASRAA